MRLLPGHGLVAALSLDAESLNGFPPNHHRATSAASFWLCMVQFYVYLIMPGGLSGRDVAIRAREIKPGVKVLLTSGYAEELVRGDDLQRENLKVLRKPYQQSDLVTALRDVLGNGST